MTKLKLTLAFLCLIWLAACGSAASPTVADTATPEAPTDTPQPTPTPTETPLPGRALLVIPESMSAEEALAWTQAVQPLAAAQGLVLDVLPDIQAGYLTAQAKLVLLPQPPADLIALVNGAPQVQFLAVSSADLPAAPNLTVIRRHPERVAFAAGYIAALTAPDWRIGGILPQTPAGDPNLQQAFTNGVKFHCGRCAPQFAPVVFFPLTAALPAGSNAVAVQAAFDELEKNIIEVIYLHPSLATAETWQALAAKKKLLIGEISPPEDVRERWIATVTEDILAPLGDLIPALAAGQGGQVIAAPLVLRDIDEERFSIGRQRLVEEAIQMMASGLLLPAGE